MTAAPPATAPRLKSHVRFVDVGEGVYFEAGEQSFLLKGANLLPVVERLAALLDGARPADAIAAALPPKLRPLFASLLQQLLAKGMARETVTAAAPAPELAALYGETLAFLADEARDPHALFAAWRATPIVAAGHGAALRTLVAGLAESGVANLLLAIDPPSAHPAEAPALEALLAAHAARDPALRWRWTDAAGIAAADPGARLLYAADAAPDPPPPALAAMLRLARPGTLVGAVRAGRGLVGPAIGAGARPPLAVWDDLPPPANPLPHPPLARAVLGAAVAFEALRAGLHAEAEGEAAAWPYRHLLEIDAHGAVASHRIASPLPLPPPSLPPRADPPRALPALYAGPAALLARIDVDGPEFPLAHRAAAPTAHRAAARLPPRIEAWAPVPQLLDLRLAMLAGALWLGPDAAGRPATVAADEAAWRRDALALAIAADPAFAPQAFAPDPETLADPDARMLARLARLHAGALPTLALLADGRAAVAAARIGPHRAIAVAADPQDALREALGDALSALQLGRPAQRQPMLALIVPHPPEDAARRAMPAFAQVAPPPHAPRRAALEPLCPGAGLVAGWIDLCR